MNGVKNGVHSFAKVTESDDIRTKCTGHIHLCFNPQEYYLYNDEFPQAKKDLLDMQISKRFSDRGLTMDVGNFVHRAGKIDREARMAELSFCYPDRINRTLFFYSTMAKNP